jgi:hypothetical protein
MQICFFKVSLSNSSSLVPPYGTDLTPNDYNLINKQRGDKRHYPSFKSSLDSLFNYQEKNDNSGTNFLPQIESTTTTTRTVSTSKTIITTAGSVKEMLPNIRNHQNFFTRIIK